MQKFNRSNTVHNNDFPCRVHTYSSLIYLSISAGPVQVDQSDQIRYQNPNSFSSRPLALSLTFGSTTYCTLSVNQSKLSYQSFCTLKSVRAFLLYESYISFFKSRAEALCLRVLARRLG